MPINLNHHILVDETGKARVISEATSGGEVVVIERLEPGDTVTFTSNKANAEIRYKQHKGAPPENTQEGSPFGAALPPGTPHKISDGKVFTVENACQVK